MRGGDGGAGAFAARNLLVSWFLSVLLVLFLPRAYGARTGPELEWGWPWTIGLTVAVGLLLYRVALRHDAVVVGPVLAVTFVATWPRLADWGDAALPGFLATGAVVLGIEVRNAAATRPALDNDPARPRHGLVGMAERVRVLGGEYTAGPTPDGGFSVVAHLPLHGEDTT